MNDILGSLPVHLKERARWHAAAKVTAPREGGQLVLYWMQTSMRWEENPALDVARHIAQALRLPLLVYQGVSNRYEYASDRHHTFILQGARDLQQSAPAYGISYALYVEGYADRSPLAELVQQAAVTVVEDMPTDPHRMFVRAAVRGKPYPVVAVDTACVVPMQLVARSYERAFEFRNRTRSLLKARLSKPWPECEAKPAGYEVDALDWVLRLDRPDGHVIESSDTGWKPVPQPQPQTGNLWSIQEIIAGCDIDHTIAPVPDTVGGSTAGTARWEHFKNTKIKKYSDHRNDPLKNPSSRLSAYLHYGMVSPFRIAREAANIDGPGAEKFLDELLIWRELAYAFCFYRPDHHLWRALPDWARETLAHHAGDPRHQTYDWESLSRAATDDQFWNAAQQSLLVRGELHNNVRMTWGKALLDWCADPKAALRLAIDLNHRYALDGRDPASYGGLLWCFGQFDRPFYPQQPIAGTVRTRPTREHAKRLDVAAYRSFIASGQPERPSVAVIGAGLAGLFAARTLHDNSWPVNVFEKSHRPAGRMSTRKADHSDFDHGTQYFTCRDQLFRRYVDSWIEQGIVACWDWPIAVYCDGVRTGVSKTERLVAVPGMNELGRHLACDLNVQYGRRVTRMELQGAKWLLRDESGSDLGFFDKVILALPAPQARDLVATSSPELAEPLAGQTYAPCWAVMLNLAEHLPVDWGGAFINSGPVRWIARNQTKPGRDSQIESLVLHASPQWSQEHLDGAEADVIDALASALSVELGLKLPAITHALAHRWRFAIPSNNQPIAGRCLTSYDQTLIACGDWASGSRVEGAFLSGAAAAGRLMRATNTG